MRRRLPPLLLIATVLLLTFGARADTVILKSGERIEGRITGESATNYTVEYSPAAGIFDSKTILKSDVDKIEKEAPDEVAFRAIKNLKPGASSLPAGKYEGVLGPLQGFVTQFPKSAHAGEIAETIAAIDAEKTRVEAGEVKIDGRWISKEEMQKERYQINGRATYAYMQDLARRNDLVGALNTFDQLEKSYPGSSVFPDAVALAHQLLTTLKPAAEQQLQSWQFNKKKRDMDTQLMAEPERGQTIAAQKLEQKRLDTAYDAATKSGVKWLPFQRQHEKTLSAIIAKAQAELTRVDALPVAKMRQSLQLTEQARAALARKDIDGADTALKEATKLWGPNEIAVRLAKEVATQKNAANAAKNATPTPVVAAAATPHPKATPAVAKPAAAPVATLPPPPEPPKSFLSTPLGLLTVGGGFIVLAIVYLAYKKKKQAAEHDLG